MSQNKYVREFKDTIRTLAGKHSIWEVWDDFLYMSAVSMANAMPFVDSSVRQSRENRFMEIQKRYSAEEQMHIRELFFYVVEALENNPEQDFLGEMYNALNLHQKQKGQFFTPYHLCDFMSKIQAEGVEEQIEKEGFISVNDPACGTGAMLIAFANTLKHMEINYQQKAFFVAQDINQTAALMCYIQLSFLGCSGIVIVGDTLAKPGIHPDNDVWYTPFYYLNFWRFRKSGLPKEEQVVNEDCEKEQMYDLVIEKDGQLHFDFGEAA